MELYSERFYQDREIQNAHLHNYNRHCSKIFAVKQSTHMQYLCKIVLKYLEESKEWKENESENEYDECILLNYWLYDKLSNSFAHDKSHIDIAFANIETIWSHLITDRTEKSYYKKYKCEEYYYKIKEKTSLYKYFEEKCLSDQDDCPYFYYKCNDINPEVVIEKLQCHERIKGRSTLTSLISTIQHSSGQRLVSSSSSHSTELTTETSQIGTKVGHSVISVAPVLLTATPLYRYTPVGSWVRKLGGYNTYSIRDIDGGEMDGFLGNTQESGDMLFDSSTNYISYQPM
ncbi:PIR Superfamily Protein [Plasmodium ovale wallikeri]|uniref:PIR Superfamily Protein n=2 Tax=Plasmodium ovale TaxID=36330 RepID=A0A1A9AHI6_PLAOA|nr:PIR Superfamily Protein [Plasmodium ovale wallikeri]SBT56825.1 PIR Superfamily Protein [Plasmodium ovale wallikeri]SBT74331.1 Plasmodium vivax Vir protein, putative [Plasmodium ovale]